MRRHWKIFLTLSFIAGCAAPPKPTKFKAEWVFIEPPMEKPMACLKEADVLKLRELLILCGKEK